MRYVMVVLAAVAALLGGCADPHARATAATRGPREPLSPERAVCNSSAEYLDRQFGFAATLTPVAPRAGELATFKAPGARPGTYILAIGVPTSGEQGRELARIAVGADGRASTRFTMPEAPANACLVVWAYPETGEGLRMARPFMVR